MIYKTMNNTQITLEPRYPFVPMFANGLPQACLLYTSDAADE